MALWGDKDSKTASGTVEIASNGNVTGSSTSFTTQAKVGNYIVISNENYLITSITDNTHCTVRAGIPGATLTAVGAGASYALSEKPAYVTTAECDGSDAGVHGDPAKVYGVSTNEVTGGADNVVSVAVQSGGSRYVEVPAVTFSPSSTTAATATILGGSVTSITVTNSGSVYTTAPSVTVADPTITFNGDTAVDDEDFTVTYNGHPFETGDAVQYLDGGGTSIVGLTDGETYYVVVVNANTISLAASLADATDDPAVVIEIDNGVGAAHTLTYLDGTATAVATLGSGDTVTHAGWVRRIVGTGGRAGRIQYETLVASGTISGDASDDIQFPDS